MKNSMLLTAAAGIALLMLLARGEVPGRAQSEAPPEKPADGAKSVTLKELKNELKEMGFLEPVKAEDTDELKKTLKERHNSAVALLNERLSEYEKGSRDITLVYEAGRLVADAKLDLAADANDKVKVLEHTLKVAERAEAYLKHLLDKGFGSKAELERARYGTLNVKVQLLRAKQMAKP
jgi:hypothetical protein